MAERPILRQHRGPAQAIAQLPPTGGENLGELIAKADILRQRCGYRCWAELAPLVDNADPKTLEKTELLQLIVKLRQQVIAGAVERL